jgi:beta-N-acetylhexosaminidase
VKTDLRRIGRAAAVLVFAGAVLLALTTLRPSKHGGAPAPTAAAAIGQPPANHGQESAQSQTCQLGGGVTVQVSGGAQCPNAPSLPAETQQAKPAPAPSAPAPTPAKSSATPSPLPRLVGARIMTGMRGTRPSASLLARARKGQIGGVILFAANISPHLHSAISALQSAALKGGNSPLLIATDQEGGPVRRLTNAPPATAPALIAPADTKAQGEATARALRARGVNTDLAPVADVLGWGGFLGSRSFGSSPDRVAAGACGFARGLQNKGVHATFKHFPGLGRATQNTDLRAVTVTATASALSADMAAYRACRPDLVMLSNAVYPALDPKLPAVLSSKIIQGLLRSALHFRGVTISDTLAAPGVAGHATAVRAAKAGVDVLLYPNEASSAHAYAQLLAAARRGQLSRGALTTSAARIHRLSK